MNLNQSHFASFTIVVTDSGLGGLSVTAGLEYQLKTLNQFGKINIIFFNSLADSNFGYNSMPTPEKKAEVFDSALSAIMKLYNPDLILIACNTLSVVYEQTHFAKESKTDVLGIIDLGVEMMLEEIKGNINNSFLLLGTPTTIFSLSYYKRLIKEGIKEEFIINQSCPLLETAIQNDPESETVHRMITEFLADAKNKESENSRRIVAALCCTHYGYSEKVFYRAIKTVFEKEFTVVNPNKKMVEFVVNKLSSKRCNYSEISVEVVSQVKLKSNEIYSIVKTIKSISPVTASALNNYTYNNSLFTFIED